MGVFGIGQPVTRYEDPRLLRGRGRYLDDINLPNQAYGYVLHSPYAHAKITAIDTSAAKAAPGVLAVFTGEDHKAAGFGTHVIRIPHERKDGGKMFTPNQMELTHDRVRYVGDYVAFVVAETPAQARDAAEMIDVSFDSLPVIIDTAKALDTDAPVIWDHMPDNEVFCHTAGDKDAVDAAFAKADHVVKQRIVINRITANSMEPRACIGHYDAARDHYTLYAGTQGVHGVRRPLANDLLKVPEEKVRVITNDVGGGFGMKGGCYPEYLLALWASREIGRPVKWVADRSEGLQSDNQARDNVTDAELALDKDGKFLAVRARTIASIGAYYHSDRTALPVFSHVGVLAGTYRTSAIHVEVQAVLTNTAPTAPYRGAGRPEAALVIERLVDIAADELGIDPAELRRRNTITKDEMPFKTGLIYTYDSGDFRGNLEMALEKADYAGYAKRKDESAARGKWRGIGVSNTVELARGQPFEESKLEFDENGTLTIYMGTQDNGQAHETMYRQMVNEKLGLEPDDVILADGDSDKLPRGGGTFGSRSTFMGGTVLYRASDDIVEKARKIAGHLLEAAEADIDFADGTFTIAGTDRSIHLKDVARAAFDPSKLPEGAEPGLTGTGTLDDAQPTFPNGCHVVEVEVDPDTGKVEIVKYTVVDDVGVVINPLTLKGQIHGGIVQGAGQALMEDMYYDPESGQLMTGSFQDYAMPRADDMVSFSVTPNVVPTPTNPLGAKGAGEAGTVGGLPGTMNAIVDALSHLGIKHIDTPATPQKLWRIIQDAKKAD